MVFCLIVIENFLNQDASFVAPEDASKGETTYIVCSVPDNGSPELTRHKRIIVTVN